jgi:hypothetical protein
MKNQSPGQPAMARKRRTCIKEFRIEAVRLAGDTATRQATVDIGVHVSVLRSFLRQKVQGPFVVKAMTRQ